MNQLIKKLLILVLLSFTQYAWGTVYYFVGTSGSTTNSGQARRTANWNSVLVGGTSTTRPSSLFTSTTAGVTDEYDLNGATINFDLATINGVKLTNSSSTTAQITVSSSSTLTFQADVSIDYSAITFNLSTGSTVIYNVSSGSWATYTIHPCTYSNLSIPSSNTSRGIMKASTTTTCTTNFELLGEIQILGNLTLGQNVTLSGTARCYFGGTLTDNRTTSSPPFPWNFYHQTTTTNVYPGTYDYLYCPYNTNLGGPVTVVNSLNVGDIGNPVILNLNNNSLTLGSSVTISYNNAGSDSSGINVSNSNSKLIVKKNAMILRPENFRKSITTGNWLNLSDIKNLEINCASNTSYIDLLSEDANGDPTEFFPSITNCEIKSGKILLEGSDILVTGTLTVHVSNFASAGLFKFPDEQIDLSSAQLIFTGSNSLTYTAGIIKNATLNKLKLNFTSTALVTLPENTTVNSEIDLFDNLSFLKLNGTTLTSKGNIVSGSGSTNGNFIGSTTSNLICSTATSTIYFDQSSSAAYTLQNLTLANGASCTLGSNLILANGVDLGTSNLTVGSNTLTFAGSSATWITRNGGQINTTGGTIEYAQTSIAGTNHSIDLSAYYTSTAGVPINNFTLNFANARTFTPPSDMTIGGTLNLSGTNNTFILNGTTLTVLGSVTSTGGKFRGSSTSNLTVQSNSDLYFDQTSEENRTLKNLTIGGSGISATLKNWLNITGGTSTSSYGLVDVIAASNNLYTQGYLTLKSNEYGTSMISTSPGNIAYSNSSNSGTLLVENYIEGNSTKGRQYRFLSSPVSGGVFWQWRDSSNSRSGRGTHITGKTGSNNTANDSFDISTTNHPSAFFFDETKAGNTTGIGNTSATEDAGWARLINAKTGTIENGKGYRVLIRGDRSITLTSATTTTPVNTTIQTRGGYIAGPVSVTITNSGTKSNNGINLVGNPYASAVDWNTIQSSSTSVDPTYVAFDVSRKSYQSYNATGGAGLMSRYISPGQGFLVYTTASSTSLVFPTSAKTTSQAGGRVFTEIKSNHLITHLRKDSGTSDATIIYFIKGATNYYDAYDAGHIENSNVNLSSLDSTNTLYNVNCMDSLIGSRIIPLSLYGTPFGTYTMTFDDVNTFKNHDVYLIDNYLNKTTKVDDMTEYKVDVNSDKFSYAEGRLQITFEPKQSSSVVTINETDLFNISPNPVKDQLHIQLVKSANSSVYYEIFNINGQTISTGTVNSNEVNINTSKLNTGIYFIKLNANNQTQTIKFIK